jgi:hypothetical protein
MKPTRCHTNSMIDLQKRWVKDGQEMDVYIYHIYIYIMDLNVYINMKDGTHPSCVHLSPVSFVNQTFSFYE